MQFIFDIAEDKYDEFVKNHPTKSHFLQSYAWGQLSRTKGLEPHYIGVERDNSLVAVALLLQKKMPLGYSYFYAPRGYVLDYNDTELLKFFTSEIKTYTKKRKAIFVKIDPDVKLHNIDQDGNSLNDGFSNYKVVDDLIELGYKHKGFNKNFEGSQPRYTFRLNLESSVDEIRANMHPTTRKILNRNNPYGLEVTLGNEETIKDFAQLMSVTSKRDDFVSSSYNYYNNFYSILSKYGMTDIYYIEVSIKDIISKTEKMIADAKEEMNALEGKKNAGKKQDLLSKLTKLEHDINEYRDYLRLYEDKVFISSIITVKYGNKVWTIHGGNHDIFRDLNSNYLLYYHILLEAKKEGYEVIDFFGTTGNPSSDNKIYGIHLFKKRFGGEYTEFIGEFDLVINNNMYLLFTIALPLRRNIIREIAKLRNKKK